MLIGLFGFRVGLFSTQNQKYTTSTSFKMPSTDPRGLNFDFIFSLQISWAAPKSAWPNLGQKGKVPGMKGCFFMKWKREKL